MSFAQRERERLAQLLIDVGPEAPTLNEGWKTRDLAAHLYIRERKPLGAAGIFVPLAKGALEKETERQKARDYATVVREWAAGPPALIKPFDSAMNTSEHFIHHEDVRRGGAGAGPREFSGAVDKQLLKLAKRFGSLSLRKSEVPVVLTPPKLPPVTVGGKPGVAERGDDVLRVLGEPGELLLWVSGRDAAQVEFRGRTDVVEGLHRSI